MAKTAHSIAAIGFAFALLGAGAAAAQDKSDRSFITKAMQGNLAEVQMGQLAQRNGGSSGVRDFGAMLAKDHSANNQKAVSVAHALNITPPTAPNDEQKVTYQKMTELKGASFDREFATHMVADHRKDIAEFSREANSSNPQVAQYAKATLPDLEKHLQAAEALSK